MINDISYLFRGLTVICDDRCQSPILILNKKDYEKFYEDFKEWSE